MVFLKGNEIALQLHELDFAKASPGSTSVKEDECFVLTVGFIGDAPALLVGQCEGGDSVADFRTRWKIIVFRVAVVGQSVGHVLLLSLSIRYHLEG